MARLIAEPADEREPMSKLSADTRAGLRSRTRLVHAGRDPQEQHGFVNTPIYRGSTVLAETIDDYQGGRNRYTYGTHGTPTTDALTTAWSKAASPSAAMRATSARS